MVLLPELISYKSARGVTLIIWSWVSDPSEDRCLLKRMDEFEPATRKPGSEWPRIDISSIFDEWFVSHPDRAHCCTNPAKLNAGYVTREGAPKRDRERYLQEEFFSSHCKLFHQRSFSSGTRDRLNDLNFRLDAKRKARAEAGKT